MNARRFLFVLIGLHALFYVLALSMDGIRIADSYDYLYQAENIREEGSFYAWTHNDPYKPDYETKRTPGYGLFLVLTGSAPALVLFIQNVLSISLWWLVFMLLRKKGMREKRAGWLLLLVVALQSNTLIYANSLLAETLFQFLVFAGFVQLMQDTSAPYAWLKACILFTLALLVKPVLLFFWIPLGIYACIRAFQLRKMRLVWPVLLMPLAVLAWSYHNQQVTGWAHYTSISTVNLKDYNTRLMLESAYGTSYADSVIAGINDSAEKISNYQARNTYIQDTCKALLTANVGAYARVHLKGMLAMLLDPGRYDYVQFFKAESNDDGLMYKLARGDFKGMYRTVMDQPPLVTFFFFLNLLGSLFLLGLALYGLRRLPRETLTVLLICGFIGYFWVLTGPVGTARYKSVLLPFMALLAGLGLISAEKKPTGSKEKVSKGFPST